MCSPTAACSGLSPEGWAREVVRAAETWGADRVVAETNQGGEMVTSVLRSVDSALPVRLVQARHGKGAGRAGRGPVREGQGEVRRRLPRARGRAVRADQRRRL